MFLKFRLMFALLIFGIGMTVLGHAEWKQAGTVKADPDHMPCAVFESRGPVDNDYIELTAFNVTEDMYFAYSESGHGGNYESVLIPVFPLNRRTDPKNEDLRVILRFNNVKGDDDLMRLVSQDSVKGITGRKGNSLHHEFRSLLEGGYPGIDLGQCYVVHVDERIPSQARGLGMMASGISLIFFFIGIIVWSFKGSSSSSSDWGGGATVAPVDTSASDFMANRLSTDLDPRRFRQNDRKKQAAAPAAQTPEPVRAPQSEEELAYRREFAERYGIGGEIMDDPNDSRPKEQETLSY